MLVDLVSDRSQTIRASVSDVEFTFVLTIALVVVIIFLFLRSFWATFIPSIVLPVVLVATFGGMYLMGYSIDNLSLMGLTIAIGFLVDDAIVMIENIVRHIEAGTPPFEAAIRGAGEIGFTIIAITLSLAAVFIPLLFMSGVVGRLFHEFAMTVMLAIFLSVFVSLTLTPMMCGRFLTRATGNSGRMRRWLESGFDRVARGYDRTLSWVLNRQFATLLVTIALIVLTGYLYVTIPKDLFPEQDTGFIFGQAQARQDIAGLPLAVQTGAGSELRRPLGVAIIGELLVSQWLTLYTTPVVYLYLDRFSDWLANAHPLDWARMRRTDVPAPPRSAPRVGATSRLV